MNLSQTYSSNYDLDLDKPFIFEKFYPIKERDYITLNLGNPEGNPNYLYWQEVINLILPEFFKVYKNTSFVLTNTNSKMQYVGCNQLSGSISPNELAYIIKNSRMHISEGGLDLDFASYYDKDIAYMTPNDELVPFWNSSHIKLNEDNDFNKIKPEDVAKKILNFLKIPIKAFDYKTVFIGENYINIRKNYCKNYVF